MRSLFAAPAFRWGAGGGAPRQWAGSHGVRGLRAKKTSLARGRHACKHVCMRAHGLTFLFSPGDTVLGRPAFSQQLAWACLPFSSWTQALMPQVLLAPDALGRLGPPSGFLPGPGQAGHPPLPRVLPDPLRETRAGAGCAHLLPPADGALCSAMRPSCAFRIKSNLSVSLWAPGHLGLRVDALRAAPCPAQKPRPGEGRCRVSGLVPCFRAGAQRCVLIASFD